MSHKFKVGDLEPERAPDEDKPIDADFFKVGDWVMSDKGDEGEVIEINGDVVWVRLPDDGTDGMFSSDRLTPAIRKAEYGGAYEHGDTNPAGLPRMPEPTIWGPALSGRRSGKSAAGEEVLRNFANEHDGVIVRGYRHAVVRLRDEQPIDDFIAEQEQPPGPKIEVGDIVRVVTEGRVEESYGYGVTLRVDDTDGSQYFVSPSRCTIVRKKGDL